MLEKYDNGYLRGALNNAIVELGHGTLKSETGEAFEIGGSSGGGSRRIIDGWVPADWRHYLQDPYKLDPW